MARSFEAVNGNRSAGASPPELGAPERGGARSSTWPASLVHAKLHRLVLLGVVALSLFLNLWQIGQNGTGNSYYAAAVKSMTQSWHNFFFASFDPGGFITVDKPPVALWIQAAFAKVLGFSGFSIHLPQAVAGTGAVLLLYLAVSRVFGKTAGLVAALVLALTPITVAINRSNNLDAWLISFTVAAAYAVVRAIQAGSLRWLLVSALMVGIAFNTKSLAGFVALPALWFAYLVTAPVSLRRRIRDLAVATSLLAIVSVSWVAAVDLTPASARPYVGGSQTNSELNLLLGYNGLGRIDGEGNGPGGGGMRGTPPRNGSLPDGVLVPPYGATPPEGVPMPPGGMFPRDDATMPPRDDQGVLQGPANDVPRMNRGGIGGFGGGQPGWLRLFGAELAGQASWLIPLGLIGGLGAMVSSLRPLKGNQSLGSIIVWGGWLLTAGAVFSEAKGIFHPYYLSYLGPAIGGMAGIAVAFFWSKLRVRSWWGLIAPLALVASAVVQVIFLRRVSDYEAWLQPTVVGAVTIASVILLVTKLRRLPVFVPAGALALGTAALLLPAFIYTQSVLGSPGSSLPYVSPQSQAPGDPGGAMPGGLDGPGMAGPNESNSGLIDYLLANRGGAKFIVATQSSMSASPIIIATGEPVMAVGGFGGGDPALTVSELAGLVEAGDLRFFLAQGAGGPGGGNSAVIQAVTNAGKIVDASAYGGSSVGTLYDLQGTADAIRSQAGP